MGTLVTSNQPNASPVCATFCQHLKSIVLPAAALVALVLGSSDAECKPVTYQSPGLTTCTGPIAFEKLLKLPGWRAAAMSAFYNDDFVCSWSYDAGSVQQACEEALEKCSQILHERVPMWKDTCRIIRIFAPGTKHDIQSDQSCTPPIS